MKAGKSTAVAETLAMVAESKETRATGGSLYTGRSAWLYCAKVGAVRAPTVYAYAHRLSS